VNFLEQLMAEWYEYRAYFVLSNKKCGKRAKGGYKGEIDVLAFDPKEQEFVHIEASADADSWRERKSKFRKKFRAAEGHYAELFRCEVGQVKKVAIVGFTKPRRKPDFGGDIEVQSVPDLIAEISSALVKKHPMEEVVPEGFPILRAIQFAVHYGIPRTSSSRDTGQQALSV